MHHDVHIVHGDPHAVLLAFDAPHLLAQFLEHLLLDFGGYGAHLRRGIGVADHEMRTDRSIESREVQRYNILTFFIFNRADDRFDQFIHKCSIGIYNLAKV